MQFSVSVVAAFAGLSLAGKSSSPQLKTRQQNACFITGTTTLPQIVADDVAQLEPLVTCDTANPTIGGVPDVEVRGTKFSSINFEGSGQSPLAFALEKFATSDPLADNDLDKFQAELAVYVATEAAMRSNGANVNQIKIPKFFLELQVSRIGVAQGETIPEAGHQVDHLLGKVQENGAGEDKALLDQVVALAAKLS